MDLASTCLEAGLGRGLASPTSRPPSRCPLKVHGSLRSWVEVAVVLGVAGLLMGVWEAVISFQ